MTIAIKVTLKEDWGTNMPCVEVVARAVVRREARLGYPPIPETATDYVVARLTPLSPEAEVCITKEHDLFFRVEPHAAERLDHGRS